MCFIVSFCFNTLFSLLIETYFWGLSIKIPINFVCCVVSLSKQCIELNERIYGINPSENVSSKKKKYFIFEIYFCDFHILIPKIQVVSYCFRNNIMISDDNIRKGAWSLLGPEIISSKRKKKKYYT